MADLTLDQFYKPRDLARLGLWETASFHSSFEFYDFQIRQSAGLLHFSWKRIDQASNSMTQHSYSW